MTVLLAGPALGPANAQGGDFQACLREDMFAIHGFDFGGWARHERQRLVDARAELHNLFAAGLIHPRVHAEYQLHEVATAFNRDRDAIGKVLLEVTRGV